MTPRIALIRSARTFGWIAAVGLLGWSISCPAAVVVMKGPDGQERHVGGWIVERSSVHVCVLTASGERTRIPLGYILKEVPACDQETLEALSPEAPEKYIKTGKALVAKREDPEARELGRRLLMIGARLNPDKYYVDACTALADTATEEMAGAEHLCRLLTARPSDKDRLARLRELLPRYEHTLNQELGDIAAGCREYVKGSPKALLGTIEGLRTQTAKRLVAGIFPNVSELRTAAAEVCPKCKGEKTVACANCGGYGATECKKCKGKGIATERYMSYRNVTVEKSCDACGQVGSVRCEVCGGVGRGICPTCLGTGLTKRWPPEFETRLHTLRQAAEDLFAGEGPWWQVPAGLKAPAFGSYTFDQDIDYTRTVYRNGIWVAP